MCSAAGLVHVATFLPLKGWRSLIPFMRMSSQVAKQTRASRGNVGYAVKADFPKKHFWTLSVWQDADSMRRFVMAEPHATAVKKFATWAGEGAAFVQWQSPDSSLDWAEAMRRLESPTFYYDSKGG